MTKDCYIGFRDTIEVDRAIRLAAAKQRITKSELLRAVVREWLRAQAEKMTGLG